MSLTYVAHGGESHATPAEEAAHAASTGLSTDAIAGGVTLLALVAFWLVATYVFKVKLPTKATVAMAALLIVGVAAYQFAPITSVVALAAGFAIALGNMVVQLMPAKRRPN